MRTLIFATFGALLFTGAASAQTIESPIDAKKKLELRKICSFDKATGQHRLDVGALGCLSHGEGKTCKQLPGSEPLIRDWMWKTARLTINKIAAGTHPHFGVPSGQTCTGNGQPTGRDVVYNQCVVVTCKTLAGSGPLPEAEDKPKPKQIRRDWVLREKPEDLALTVKKASPAKFAFTRNFETGGNMFSAQVTLGAPISGHALALSEEDFRDPFTFTPFLSVNRVEDTRGEDVTNLSAGFSFNSRTWDRDLLGGTTHVLDISAELVTDEEADSLVLDGTLLYQPFTRLPEPVPDFFIDGVDLDPFRLVLEPTFRVDLGRVFDPGDNPRLAFTDNYLRAGGTVRAVLFGDPDLKEFEFLKDLELSAEYTLTHGFKGALDEFQRFEARLD